MKYSKYFGAKRGRFIKSKSALAPKGGIHLLSETSFLYPELQTYL
jgi:hypothetical protein